MKIKRFFATDMRNAIRQVRETLGPDAVILSNKPVDGGVELMAALDFDESAFAVQEPADEYAGNQEIRNSVVTPFPPVETDTAETRTAVNKPRAQRVEWSQDPILTDMRHEMQAMRRMMENELSELTWRDMGKRQPEVQELLRRLMILGLTPELCQNLVEKCSGFDGLDQGWRRALYYLASQLETTGDDLLEHGGAVAIIGPTGVGKTTTLAKLASRYALRYGNRHVALISTDNYRIGAQEQLTTYARILDVPMRSAANAEELKVALNAFSDKRLILIDTAGMSQRDVRISEQLSLLRVGNKRVRCLLALSATTQQAAIRHAISAFGTANPDAIILTKLDEAGSLGGVLSAIVDNKLKISYVTDGQKVPEDLHLARPHTLVSRTVNLAYQDSAGLSEQFLALALGGARANANV